MSDKDDDVDMALPKDEDVDTPKKHKDHQSFTTSQIQHLNGSIGSKHHIEPQSPTNGKKAFVDGTYVINKEVLESKIRPNMSTNELLKFNNNKM